MNYKFNEGFYWGTAISALQTEGTHEGDGKSDTTFDVWFKNCLLYTSPSPRDA